MWMLFPFSFNVRSTIKHESLCGLQVDKNVTRKSHLALSRSALAYRTSHPVVFQHDHKASRDWEIKTRWRSKQMTLFFCIYDSKTGLNRRNGRIQSMDKHTRYIFRGFAINLLVFDRVSCVLFADLVEDFFTTRQWRTRKEQTFESVWLTELCSMRQLRFLTRETAREIPVS